MISWKPSAKSLGSKAISEMSLVCERDLQDMEQAHREQGGARCRKSTSKEDAKQVFLDSVIQAAGTDDIYL